MLYLQRNATLKLYQKLNDEYGKPKKHRDLVQHLEKMTHFLYFHSVTANTIYLIFTYLSDEECFQRKLDGTGDGYVCGVLYPFWFPLNLDYTPWKEIIHCIDIIEVIYVTPKLAVACIFFYGGIKITEDKINRLRKFIEGIRITEYNAKEVTQNFKDAAKDYSAITE